MVTYVELGTLVSLGNPTNDSIFFFGGGGFGGTEIVTVFMTKVRFCTMKVVYCTQYSRLENVVKNFGLK